MAAQPPAPSRLTNHAGLIWAIADLLRGDYKQAEYQKVILPLVVLRRLDCVLEPTKDRVLQRLATLTVANVGPVLQAITGIEVYNTSPLTMKKILGDPAQVAGNLRAWIAAFDPETRDVIEKFDFDAQVGRLDRAKLLYLVLSKVTEVDLHPDTVSNNEMGYLYEELVRKFSELSNETAGEHFTPREVIRLMVDLLFLEDDDALRTPGIVRTLLDPACGTGGMLSVAQDHLRSLNPGARLEAYGQELNAETYAVCRSDMMLKGQKASNIRLGNSFSEDAFPHERYDYLLANPPFGVEWKKVQREVEDERAKLGFNGRFGAGLPRINDGSFLFLQHMISKLKRPEEGGGRLAIVFNASPLTTGVPGSGESEIRRWIIENDWLEGIVALPDQLFYNTGIDTYVWIVTNRKRPERRGRVQLVDAREHFVKKPKSLGEKRKDITDEQIAEIARLYGDFSDGEKVKILPNEAFGTQRITVERPLRLRWEVTEATLPAIETATGWTKLSDPERLALVDRLTGLAGFNATDRAEVTRRLGPLPKAIEKAVWDALAVRDPEAPVITDKKGRPEPDPDLRDNENVPLPELIAHFDEDPTERLATRPYRDAVDAFVQQHVTPFDEMAWVAHERTLLTYEIPVRRLFYRASSPRPVAAIADDIARLEQDIRRQLERASTASERLATTVRDALYVGEEHPRLRLKWLAEVRVSNVDKKSYEDQLPVLLCNYTDVYYNRQIVAGMEFMAATATSDQIARFGLRSGDVLVTKDSETADDIAIPSLVSKDMPGVVCGYHLAIIRPGRRLDGRYLYWHLASPVARQYFDALATGVTRVGIRAEHIENLVINVPPLTVQAAIAEALDDEALRVEAIKGDVLRQLDLLDERRVALSAGLALEGVLAR